mmetsp:Transcript_970/g.3231  ORF Transcript_970/g.3231 Transcript_970/m.3231 type:complete len:2496 (+) Transcript_970:95-7582(+)
MGDPALVDPLENQLLKAAPKLTGLGLGLATTSTELPSSRLFESVALPRFGRGRDHPTLPASLQAAINVNIAPCSTRSVAPGGGLPGSSVDLAVGGRHGSGATPHTRGETAMHAYLEASRLSIASSLQFDRGTATTTATPTFDAAARARTGKVDPKAAGAHGEGSTGADADANRRKTLFAGWRVALQKLPAARKREIARMLQACGADVVYAIGASTTHVVTAQHEMHGRLLRLAKSRPVVADGFIEACVRSGERLPLPEPAGGGSGLASGNFSKAAGGGAGPLSAPRLHPLGDFSPEGYNPQAAAEVSRHFVLVRRADRRYVCVELQVSGPPQATYRVVVCEGRISPTDDPSTSGGHVAESVDGNGSNAVDGDVNDGWTVPKTMLDWVAAQRDRECGMDTGNTHPAMPPLAIPITVGSIEDRLANAENVLTSVVNTYLLVGYARVELDAVDPRVGSAELARSSGWEGRQGGAATGVRPEVARLVCGLYAAAQASLRASLDYELGRVSASQIESAEVLLVQIHAILLHPEADRDVASLEELSRKFFSALPFKAAPTTIDAISALAEYQQLCRTLRDLLPSSEAAATAVASGVEGSMLAALHCDIELVEHGSALHDALERRVIEDNENVEPHRRVIIRRVYALKRRRENETFNSQRVGNRAELFHATRASSIYGILSQGLLLPTTVVDDFDGQRRDAGMLGAGIYFGDRPSTAAQYSEPCTDTESRLMVVADVALGNVFHTTAKDTELTAPPAGFDSVHGVSNRISAKSDFVDDEFVIYDPQRQRLKYLVEFDYESDAGNAGRHTVAPPSVVDDVRDLDDLLVPQGLARDAAPVDLNDVYNCAVENVESGLQVEDAAAADVPVKETHVRASLIDLAADVTIFQKYTNMGARLVEAKYVFRVDNGATVCGFEAYINEKHVIGRVKEKEQARKEYKAAIEAGHGAYLLEEQKEKPDVFTLNVGNIPPGAVVIIKIRYVAELAMKAGRIEFTLPDFVTTAAGTIFDKLTQATVETVFTDLEGSSMPFTAVVGMAMPREIRGIETSHPCWTKRSDTMATIELAPQPFSAADGPVSVLVSVADAAIPRLWVEDTADGHRACMLAVAPVFGQDGAARTPPIVVALDASCSMAGSAFKDAQKVACLALHALTDGVAFNVVVFGTAATFAFVGPRGKSEASLEEALRFVAAARPSRGATNLATVVRGHAILKSEMSMIVVTDGQFAASDQLIAEVEAAEHVRLFVCGVGRECDRHLVRRCSRVGRGVPFFFDVNLKSKWVKDAALAVEYAASPCLSDICIEWHQHSDELDTPEQAPAAVQSLYAGCRSIVYAFAENCTSATVHARYNGRPMSTVVSTSEIAVVRGSLIHTLTARALVRDWEEGCGVAGGARDKAERERRTQDMINLSVEYQVVTSGTSFVAVEERDGENLAIVTTPTVAELASACAVDQLLEQGWRPPTTQLSPQSVLYALLVRLTAACGGADEGKKAMFLTDYQTVCSAYSPTHPDRLRAAMLLGMYVEQVCNQPAEAAALLQASFDGAISELDTLSEESYTTTTLHMQWIRDRIGHLTPHDGLLGIVGDEEQCHSSDFESPATSRLHVANDDTKYSDETIVFDESCYVSMVRPPRRIRNQKSRNAVHITVSDDEAAFSDESTVFDESCYVNIVRPLREKAKERAAIPAAAAYFEDAEKSSKDGSEELWSSNDQSEDISDEDFVEEDWMCLKAEDVNKNDRWNDGADEAAEVEEEALEGFQSDGSVGIGGEMLSALDGLLGAAECDLDVAMSGSAAPVSTLSVVSDDAGDLGGMFSGYPNDEKKVMRRLDDTRTSVRAQGQVEKERKAEAGAIERGNTPSRLQSRRLFRSKSKAPAQGRDEYGDHKEVEDAYFQLDAALEAPAGENHTETSAAAAPRLSKVAALSRSSSHYAREKKIASLSMSSSSKPSSSNIAFQEDKVSVRRYSSRSSLKLDCRGGRQQGDSDLLVPLHMPAPTAAVPNSPPPPEPQPYHAPPPPPMPAMGGSPPPPPPPPPCGGLPPHPPRESYNGGAPPPPPPLVMASIRAAPKLKRKPTPSTASKDSRQLETEFFSESMSRQLSQSISCRRQAIEQVPEEDCEDDEDDDYGWSVDDIPITVEKYVAFAAPAEAVAAAPHCAGDATTLLDVNECRASVGFQEVPVAAPALFADEVASTRSLDAMYSVTRSLDISMQSTGHAAADGRSASRSDIADLMGMRRRDSIEDRLARDMLQTAYELPQSLFPSAAVVHPKAASFKSYGAVPVSRALPSVTWSTEKKKKHKKKKMSVETRLTGRRRTINDDEGRSSSGDTVVTTARSTDRNKGERSGLRTQTGGRKGPRDNMVESLELILLWFEWAILDADELEAKLQVLLESVEQVPTVLGAMVQGRQALQVVVEIVAECVASADHMPTDDSFQAALRQCLRPALRLWATILAVLRDRTSHGADAVQRAMRAFEASGDKPLFPERLLALITCPSASPEDLGLVHQILSAMLKMKLLS